MKCSALLTRLKYTMVIREKTITISIISHESHLFLCMNDLVVLCAAIIAALDALSPPARGSLPLNEKQVLLCSD